MASIYGEELDNQIVADGILLAQLVAQGKVEENDLHNSSALDENLYDEWKSADDGTEWADYHEVHSADRRVWNPFKAAGGDDSHSGGSWYCVRQTAVNVLGGWIAMGKDRPYTPKEAHAFLKADKLDKIFLATIKGDKVS